MQEGPPEVRTCRPRTALVGMTGSGSFAQGPSDEQFAEITTAVQHREEYDLTSADGEHQPIRPHEQLAVAIDPFSLQFREDTRSQRHGRRARDVARDLPIEMLRGVCSIPRPPRSR